VVEAHFNVPSLHSPHVTEKNYYKFQAKYLRFVHLPNTGQERYRSAKLPKLYSILQTAFRSIRPVNIPELLVGVAYVSSVPVTTHRQSQSSKLSLL
jgi:hypothetical protein